MRGLRLRTLSAAGLLAVAAACANELVEPDPIPLAVRLSRSPLSCTVNTSWTLGPSSVGVVQEGPHRFTIRLSDSVFVAGPACRLYPNQGRLEQRYELRQHNDGIANPDFEGWGPVVLDATASGTVVMVLTVGNTQRAFLGRVKGTMDVTCGWMATQNGCYPSTVELDQVAAQNARGFRLTGFSNFEIGFNCCEAYLPMRWFEFEVVAHGLQGGN